MYCLSKRHGLTVHMEYTVSKQIICLRLREKNAVFRDITELTKNLVGVRRTIIDTLLSEQFSAHFGVCCVVTRSILKPTDAITTANPQEMYEMLIFCQRLHISGSVKWPLSYKHNLLDMELFPWEYTISYTSQN